MSCHQTGPTGVFFVDRERKEMVCRVKVGLGPTKFFFTLIYRKAKETPQDPLAGKSW